VAGYKLVVKGECVWGGDREREDYRGGERGEAVEGRVNEGDGSAGGWEEKRGRDKRRRGGGRGEFEIGSMGVWGEKGRVESP